MVAAANPPEQAADGWDISPPLANRFCHLDWDLQAREWADGIVAGFAQPACAGHDQAEVAAGRIVVVVHRGGSAMPSGKE